jgi:hypothetical protein
MPRVASLAVRAALVVFQAVVMAVLALPQISRLEILGQTALPLVVLAELAGAAAVAATA